MTVAMSMFLATELFDAACIKAINQFCQWDGFDILLGNELRECGEEYCFVVVAANRGLNVNSGMYETKEPVIYVR